MIVPLVTSLGARIALAHSLEEVSVLVMFLAELFAELANLHSYPTQFHTLLISLQLSDMDRHH